jgi:sugar diacid utilization regulator
MTAAGNGHGIAGVARVLSKHTSKPVMVQDSAGRVIATSGLDVGSDAIARWQTAVFPAEPAGVVVRQDGRYLAVARPHGRVLGGISLLDSDEAPTAVDLFLLEQAAAVLGWQLLHERRLAETELGLWGDFMTELMEEPDAGRVRAHAQRLGYDLDRPHRALLVVPDKPSAETLQDTVRRATERLGGDCMVTRRNGGVVVVVGRDLDWSQLASAISGDGGAGVRIGVGRAHRLEEISKSLDDAEFALKVTNPEENRKVAVFDDLGIWRLLAGTNELELQELVDRWIGVLVKYDREHHSQLMKTLYAYLNEFGALESTAAKLHVHRNTLKYRLARIAELTGWDLNDADQRFHLNLACRAWLVQRATAVA